MIFENIEGKFRLNAFSFDCMTYKIRDYDTFIQSVGLLVLGPKKTTHTWVVPRSLQEEALLEELNKSYPHSNESLSKLYSDTKPLEGTEDYGILSFKNTHILMTEHTEFGGIGIVAIDGCK